MPAKTTPQPDDLSNPYGYSEMDWAAQLDPAYAVARAEVRRLSVGEEGTLSVKVKELVVLGVLASHGLQYGVEAHMRRAIAYGATKEELFEAIKAVTLHALLRCFLQIIWRSNEPQVSMLGVWGHCREEPFSAKKNRQAHAITRVHLCPNGNLSVHFRQSRLRELPCTSMQYRHIKCKNPRRSMCKVTPRPYKRAAA
jgi:AhpD family alkylhydroperoxidase